MIYTIRMIRKTSNFLPAIAGIALMTISACGSAAVSDFTKATQDAAIAAALKTAADEAQKAQDAAVAAVRCTTPVCDNVVNADDLPSYPTAAASSASAFLTITGTQIDTTDVTRIVSGQRVDPTIRGATRAGDNMDGYRYFQGQFNGTGDTVFFAGILPTTNLGAPLTSAPAETEWDGTYSLGGSENNDIMFNIDFANRRITAGHAPFNSHLRFNLGFSDSGVISGLVLEHDSGPTTDIFGFAHATGLIGTEGLVGVFIDSAEAPTAGRIHGGFVANNPDTNP